jgi:hypothetical protein
MVEKLNQAITIAKGTETKLVRSLILPVSNSAGTFSSLPLPSPNNGPGGVSFKPDNVKTAKINSDPAIRNKKIDFSQVSAPEKPAVTPRAGKRHLDDIINSTIKQVTAADPVLNDLDMDMQDQGTLALTGSILSAINLPQVEPIKLTVNVLTAGAKKDELKESIKAKDPEGIGKSLVNYTKSYWGTIVSGAKFTDIIAVNGTELGLLSVGLVGNVSKVTGKISTAANRLALPISFVGTGLAVWDIKKENEKLAKARSEFNNFQEKRVNTPDKVLGRIRTNYQERKSEQEITDKKINLALKGLGSALSGISSYALLVSVTNPARAYVATPVSLAAGVAGSITLSLADEKVRESLGKKMQILKKRYFG